MRFLVLLDYLGSHLGGRLASIGGETRLLTINLRLGEFLQSGEIEFVLWLLLLLFLLLSSTIGAFSRLFFLMLQ